jgi:hypothetical protein
VLVSALAAEILAQSIVVTRVGDNVAVRAPGIGFIKGDALARLRDGRSVRVDVELAILPGPGQPAAAESRETFVLSYDLWEERFAVTQVTRPSRSIAYLTSSAAEAWCLEQVTIPVGTIGRLARESFWVRLGHRVLDADSPLSTDGSADFSLRGLIDTLSKRRKTEAATHSIEAGPFQLR